MFAGDYHALAAHQKSGGCGQAIDSDRGGDGWIRDLDPGGWSCHLDVQDRAPETGAGTSVGNRHTRCAGPWPGSKIMAIFLRLPIGPPAFNLRHGNGVSGNGFEAGICRL